MSALGVEPTLESEPPIRDVTPSRRWLFELVGVGWVIAAAVAVMLPALLHGSSLGPYDFLWRYGLSKQPGVPTGFVGSKAGDQISQFIPWSTLAWKQVHQGHLPLWNPYSALGTPLAFNWQSATFSIPALVGYVFPLSLAYTVQVLTTLAVAGTGAYVFARTLKLGVLAGALAGTVFELSGSVPALSRLAHRIGDIHDRMAVRRRRPDCSWGPPAPPHRPFCHCLSIHDLRRPTRCTGDRGTGNRCVCCGSVHPSAVSVRAIRSDPGPSSRSGSGHGGRGGSRCSSGPSGSSDRCFLGAKRGPWRRRPGGGF